MVRWLAALIVIASLAAFATRKGKDTAPLAEATFAVKIAPAVLTVSASGELSSSVEQSITLAGINGQIEDIVEEGTRVAKGDVVARLSTFQWEEQERNARADVYRKQAEMKRATRENATTSADEHRKIDDKHEDLELNQRVAEYLDDGPDERTVESLGLKITKAQVEEAALARRLAVQEALKDKGFLSELDYESIKTDLEKARLDRGKQENLLADKKAGPRDEERKKSHLLVDKFDLDLDLARRSADSAESLRKLALAKKEAELADRVSAVEEKSKLRARAVIRAPIAGTVIYGPQAMRGTPIGVGALAYSGMLLVKIVQRGTMLATLDVPERWLDRVVVGAHVRLKAGHRPAEYDGVVSTVSRLATAKDDDAKSLRTFVATVRLNVDDPAIKPAMTCEAQVEIGRHDGVARLPVDLVRKRAGNQLTLLARRGNAHEEVAATLVDEDRDFVYVTGLAAGELLVY